jgi:drug/metabolite transporter (DMT)-like permease
MTAQMFKPILMAVCAGVFIASYTVVDAQGVRASETVLQYIIYLTLFQSIPIPMLAFFKTRSALTQAVRDHWRVGAMGGVFYLASYGLVLFALSLDAVAKVSALRETSVIIGAIIAALFFRERFGWRRMLSAFVIVCGIILIKVST